MSELKNRLTAPNVVVKINDERPYNVNGKFHRKTIAFANVDGGLFCKYGEMKEWERAELNHTYVRGRIVVWGKVTGQPDDIRLGIVLFQHCLMRIHMKADWENAKITSILHNN